MSKAKPEIAELLPEIPEHLKECPALVIEINGMLFAVALDDLHGPYVVNHRNVKKANALMTSHFTASRHCYFGEDD